MTDSACDSILILSSEIELPTNDRIWGTGGWLKPEEREALDWLTLSRFMGWGATVVHRTNLLLDRNFSFQNRLIVIACEPNSIEDQIFKHIANRIELEPIVVVARIGQPGTVFASLSGAARTSDRISGRALEWIGPGEKSSWYCRNKINANRIALSKEISIWATLDGVPLVVAKKMGQGLVVTIGFHPSRARDTDGATTALLKHLLIWGSLPPVAWIDLKGSLVLRIDDPGSAESVYHRSFSFPKLQKSQWEVIGNDLKQRNARMSIGYSAGWVDDGDTARGVLKVAGVVPSRIPGQVYPSPLVTYQDRNGHEPGTFNDYESEFRGIQALRKAGLGDVELHGYTHMHPDSASWAKAIDRYESLNWYRELGHPAMTAITARPLAEHPLALGISAFRQYFHVQPTTLICPGDEWTNEVLECALSLGLHLVSSYYLALRYRERFCWAQHVCSPYLDQPDPAWFEAGLPIVGYFHDYDVALKGVNWMRNWLDQWQSAGARKFMDFRELAAAVSRTYSLEEHGNGLRLMVRDERAPRLVRPLEVMIRVSEGKLPSQVSVSLDNKDLWLKVCPLDHSMGSVILPASV